MDTYDYGEYERLARDPRTKAMLRAIHNLARDNSVDYVIVGGYASYLQTRNPPEDYPDVDIIIRERPRVAARFIDTLSELPGFKRRFFDTAEDAVFATFVYRGEIQLDVFSSTDAPTGKARRIRGVNVEPIEPLIIEKLIRATEADVKMAIDLLARGGYNRPLLAQLAREHRLSGVLATAGYFARRLAVGRLTKAGLGNVVRRLASA